MWAAYNLNSTTAIDATSCSSVGSSTGVLDINVSSFGLAFGYAFVDPTTGATWTGLTEDFDRIPATFRYSGASIENGSTAGAPMTIHVTSVSNIVGASVSYR